MTKLMKIDYLGIDRVLKHGSGEIIAKMDQALLVRDTMENGFVPFGQVEKSNLNSLKLQQKIGMTRSENLIVWMWK